MSSPKVSSETLLNVKNVLADYCIAIDDQNFQLLHQVFTPDTIANYGTVTEGNNDIRGVDSIIAKVEEVLKDKRTQHALSTQRITLLPDGSCDVRTYFQAHTFGTDANGELSHTTFFGYYDDHLTEVAEGTWRILKRTVSGHVSPLNSLIFHLADEKSQHPRIKNNSSIATHR